MRIDRSELEAALAAEQRRRVRKRLLIVTAILAGRSIQEAVAEANATRECVERCLQRVRHGGLPAILRDFRRRRPKWRMTDAQVEETRREIASALAGPLRPEVKARLLAIDIVLSGRPLEEAMASAQVLRDAVQEWLRLVARDGLAPALARWERKGPARRPLIDADPAALRELAAKEANPRIRKRMLALACVAEGMSPLAASIPARLDQEAVRKRIRRFRKEGLEAFYDRAPAGRRQKLSQDQLRELRAEIRQRPDAGYQPFIAFVAARFGVRYSCEGLRQLFKREFGIVSRRRQFVEGSKTMAAGTSPGGGLAQHLSLDALHGALARAKDPRLKRKLIALIQLAQGWEPRRVAIQVGTTTETLGNWVTLHDRLGIRGLHHRF